MDRHRLWRNAADRMAEFEEPRRPPAFRFERVDRIESRIQSPRMIDVVPAAPQRTPVDAVDDVKHQRRVDRNRRMQAARRLPRPIPQTGHELPLLLGGLPGEFDPVHDDRIPV